MQDIEKATGQRWDSKINKSQLVELCVYRLEKEVEQRVQPLVFDVENPADWILEVYKSLLDYLLSINLAFFNDLKKHYQEAYQHMITNGDRLIFDEVAQVLHRGKDSGQFTAEVEPELECVIHKMMLERIVWELRFETRTYTTEQMFNHLFKARFKGICRR